MCYYSRHNVGGVRCVIIHDMTSTGTMCYYSRHNVDGVRCVIIHDITSIGTVCYYSQHNVDRYGVLLFTIRKRSKQRARVGRVRFCRSLFCPVRIFRARAFVVALLSWRFCRGAFVVALLLWRFCRGGGGFVVAVLSWRFCRGGFVVAGLSWRVCRGDFSRPTYFAINVSSTINSSPIHSLSLALIHLRYTHYH